LLPALIDICMLHAIGFFLNKCYLFCAVLKTVNYVRKLCVCVCVCVFSGKCDDVFQLLMQYLNLDVPAYSRFVAYCCTVNFECVCVF